MAREKQRKQSGFREGQREWDAGLPERLDIKLGPGGRVVIPAIYRKAMKVSDGDRLMARIVDGELRLITPEMSIKRAQRMAREIIPEGVDLIADLFEMRRQEVEDELKRG
jgi:bifunctional DNA-binding transcriptional regulator/antitoxin component of YhaV-PrlF toxin-antitoxin module